jgi:hypothetical protein
MIEHRLARKIKISRRAAHELILLMAKEGNHNLAFTTASSVKKYFKLNGYDYDILVQAVRKYPEPIPLVENFIPSTGFASPGLKVSRVDACGNEDLQLEGPGAITMFGYQAQFENAIENIEIAIKQSSPQHFLSACTNGIASTEGYINFKAEEWNKKHPENPLIDTRQSPIRFDDKIDIWLPIMSSGKKLDKSGKNWNDFKRLKTIRNNIAIHPKSSGYAFSLKELSELINCFKTGIAGILVQLHQLFEQRIPSRIIRYMYAPEVEIVEVK